MRRTIFVFEHHDCPLFSAEKSALRAREITKNARALKCPRALRYMKSMVYTPPKHGQKAYLLALYTVQGSLQASTSLHIVYVFIK
jgi:hypothetical protein